jgi:hypothetical protein
VCLPPAPKAEGTHSPGGEGWGGGQYFGRRQDARHSIGLLQYNPSTDEMHREEPKIKWKRAGDWMRFKKEKRYSESKREKWKRHREKILREREKKQDREFFEEKKVWDGGKVRTLYYWLIKF